MIVSMASICAGTVGRPKCRSETWNTVNIAQPPSSSSEPSDDSVSELRGRRRAAKVPRDGLPLADHALHRIANAFRARVILQMFEHETRGVDERAGIRNALPRNVR